MEYCLIISISKSVSKTKGWIGIYKSWNCKNDVWKSKMSEWEEGIEIYTIIIQRAGKREAELDYVQEDKD